MNVKEKQAATLSRIWPWLAVGALLVPIGVLLSLGASDHSPSATVVPAAHSVSTTATMPQPTITTAAPIETAEALVPDGIVDPVPAVTHLPVAHGEVPNEQKIHAGDDSMFLKDDGKGDKDEDKEGV